MSKLLAITVALGLAISFAVPGFAANKAPTTKSACEKGPHEVGSLSQDLLEGRLLSLLLRGVG
jgi:hypothetical protein